VYWVAPPRIASMAALATMSGAVKSGSPTLMLMTSMPARLMAAACLTISMTRNGSMASTREATWSARAASALGF